MPIVPPCVKPAWLLLVLAAASCGGGSAPPVDGDPIPPSATEPPVGPGGPAEIPGGVPVLGAPFDPVYAGIAAADTPCVGGWCWANFPRGATPSAGWASAHDGVWLVGERGMTLHHDGREWTAHWAGARDLFAVWSSADGQTWALARDGVMLRWDGEAWSETGTVAPCEPDASSADGVAWCWTRSAPGAAQSVARFDGTTWSELAGPAELSTGSDVGIRLWAAGADDVFALTRNAVFRFRAGAWTKLELPRAVAISGSAPDDVWLLAPEEADRFTVWHFDGSTWSRAVSLSRVYDLFVAARGDVWVTGFDGGYHLAGGAWSAVADTPLSVYAAAGAGDVWGVGVFHGSPLVRWNGVSWTPVAHLGGGVKVLHEEADGGAMALVETEDGSVALARYDGRSWSVLPGSRLPGASLARVMDSPIHFGGADDVQLWYDATCFRWNGREWSGASGACRLVESSIPLGPDGARGRWSPRPGVMFAAGMVTTWPPSAANAYADEEQQDAIWAWDGGAWVQQVLGPAYGVLNSSLYKPHRQMAIWGATPDDGWAIMREAYRWDGRAWTRHERAPEEAVPRHPMCLWGTGPDDVWASQFYRCRPRSAWHWDGARWSEVATLVYLECGTGSWARSGGGAVWRREMRAGSPVAP